MEFGNVLGACRASVQPQTLLWSVNGRRYYRKSIPITGTETSATTKIQWMSSRKPAHKWTYHLPYVAMDFIFPPASWRPDIVDGVKHSWDKRLLPHQCRGDELTSSHQLCVTDGYVHRLRSTLFLTDEKASRYRRFPTISRRSTTLIVVPTSVSFISFWWSSNGSFFWWTLWGV